jgi:hypothetical protein
MKDKMLPTPAKFHYIFNLRELSRVFQGILLTPTATVKTGGFRSESQGVPFQGGGITLLRIWKHECARVFGDKLTNLKVKSIYYDFMDKQLTETFGIDMADDARVIPLAMASNERMICFFFFLFPKSTSLMWWKYAAVCLLACLVAPCQAYFRGDPVLCCTSSSPNRTCISRVPSLDLHQNIFPRNKSLTNTNISQTMTVVSVRACPGA